MRNTHVGDDVDETDNAWKKEDTVVATAELSLTAGDRCDRCGAQAYVRVELTEGAELLFCAHHARQHEDKLRQIAVTFTDETSRLEN